MTYMIWYFRKNYFFSLEEDEMNAYPFSCISIWSNFHKSNFSYIDNDQKDRKKITKSTLAFPFIYQPNVDLFKYYLPQIFSA